MYETVVYQIKPEYFMGNEFSDSKNCAMARLFKEHFPGREVEASCVSVQVDRTMFKLGTLTIDGKKINEGFSYPDFNLLQDKVNANEEFNATIEATETTQSKEFKEFIFDDDEDFDEDDDDIEEEDDDDFYDDDDIEEEDDDFYDDDDDFDDDDLEEDEDNC